MRIMLLALTGLTALALTSPAVAQVRAGADSGGVGVQVGPLGIGVGRDYDGRSRRDSRNRRDGYARGECREVRTKTYRPDGRVVYRTKRVCD